jgi:hypothetical protein
MTGRMLIMLVALSAMVVSRQPALAQSAPASVDRVTRSHWTDRLAVGLSRSIARTALLQRVVFDAPKPSLTPRLDLDTHPVQRHLPSPFRFCLPPPNQR